MAKLSAWMFTIIGVFMTLQVAGVSAFSSPWAMWVVALAFLVVGISKLVRNYSRK